MPKTATLRVQVDPKLKESAEAILKKMGIDMSVAIGMFFHAVKYHRGMPGDFKVPNRKTRKAIRDMELGRNVKEYRDVEEMYRDLGIK